MLKVRNCKRDTASCSSEVLYLRALRETRKGKKKKKKTFFPLENKALGSFVVKLNRNLIIMYYTGRDLPQNT